MEESHGEGVATHTDPESCVTVREDGREALTGERAGRVLPIELRIGDRLIDETGEWEVIGPLYRSPGGKNAGARVQKVGRPDVTEVRTWGAHERIAVRRATTEEGKR